MARQTKSKAFALESDLCAAFIASIGDQWQAYAETAGWDILLVRKSDGYQVGIEAKLKLNAKVISQAIEPGSVYSITNAGPDHRAVLVPSGETSDLAGVASHLGITVIRMFAQRTYGVDSFLPALPVQTTRWRTGVDNEWFDWCPAKRCKLPDYIPDVTAGSSAPVQLTEWKVAAIKIAVTIELRGHVTREDFKYHGIDFRRWVTPGFEWLKSDENRNWVRGENMPDFKAQHPTVYAQIAAEADRWLPNRHLLESRRRVPRTQQSMAV